MFKSNTTIGILFVLFACLSGCTVYQLNTPNGTVWTNDPQGYANVPAIEANKNPSHAVVNHPKSIKVVKQDTEVTVVKVVNQKSPPPASPPIVSAVLTPASPAKKDKKHQDVQPVIVQPTGASTPPATQPASSSTAPAPDKHHKKDKENNNSGNQTTPIPST